MGVRGVEGTGEPAPPGPAVAADLAEGLDDQRILADALLDRGSLPALTCSASIGASLKLLGAWAGSSTRLGPSSLPIRCAPGRGLRPSRAGQGCVAEIASRSSIVRRDE
jgi:hypothetical protein